MKQQTIYVYSYAAHIWPANEESPPNIKAQLQTAWGKRFRRLNHFTELALIGAKSCVSRSNLPVQSNCDIYLASEHGNVADVALITQSMYKQQTPPMPLAFLNVPNNIAGFYLAQELRLHSSNLTIAQRTFAFETALDIAMFNIAHTDQTNACALVGNVEACAYPLAQHRQRMVLPTRLPLAEGSSWLYIGGNPNGALARCEWVKFSPDLSSLLTFLTNQTVLSSTYLASGYGMDNAHLERLASALAINNHYNPSIAYHHHTHCAYTIASFLSEHPGHCLLYINRDSQNRYVAICITKGTSALSVE